MAQRWEHLPPKMSPRFKSWGLPSCRLSFLLVLVLAHRVFLQVRSFVPLHKPALLNSKLIRNSEGHRFVSHKLLLATIIKQSWFSFYLKPFVQIKDSKQFNKKHMLQAYCLIKSAIHEEFASGIFLQANAQALSTKSLTDSLNAPLASVLSCFLTLKKEKWQSHVAK